MEVFILHMPAADDPQRVLNLIRLWGILLYPEALEMEITPHKWKPPDKACNRVLNKSQFYLQRIVNF